MSDTLYAKADNTTTYYVFLMMDAISELKMIYTIYFCYNSYFLKIPEIFLYSFELHLISNRGNLKHIFYGFINYFITSNIHRKSFGYKVFQEVENMYIYLSALALNYHLRGFVNNTRKKRFNLLLLLHGFAYKTRWPAHRENVMTMCCQITSQ